MLGRRGVVLIGGLRTMPYTEGGFERGFEVLERCWAVVLIGGLRMARQRSGSFDRGFEVKSRIRRQF